MLLLLIDAIIKENVNGALFVIKSICFCNFVGFHKSSASKKRYVPTTCITYPLFLATPVPIFFKLKKNISDHLFNHF
jgi:hypothetical protein